MIDYEKEEWMIFLNQVQNILPHMEPVTEISNTVRSSSIFNPVKKSNAMLVLFTLFYFF